MAILVPVTSADETRVLADLAATIWNEHFPPIIGQAQVDYMVAKFQSYEAITKQLEDGYLYYFVTVDNREVGGYVGLVPRPEMQAMQISKFYLLKERRGRGLARPVIDEISDIAAAQGYKGLYLTVNKYNNDSIRAYEALGFECTGTLEMDIGGGFIMDDYEMEKSIA